MHGLVQYLFKEIRFAQHGSVREGKPEVSSPAICCHDITEPLAIPEVGACWLTASARSLSPVAKGSGDPELLRSPGWINDAHQTWTLSNWLS